MKSLPFLNICKNPFKIYELAVMNRWLVRNKRATVLDFGCGKGLQAIINSYKFNKIICIDPKEESITIARKNILNKIRRGEIQYYAKKVEEMGFENDFFDGIVSYCVLEHIENYSAVLAELFRIVKPGGWILLSIDSLAVIEDPVLLQKHATQFHVVKYFRMNEIKEICANAGFQNIQAQPILVSSYAEELFKKALDVSFQFGVFTGFIATIKLFIHERFKKRENEGLFIIVKANK